MKPISIGATLFAAAAFSLGVFDATGPGQEPKKPTGYWAFVDVTEKSQPDKEVRPDYPATITGRRGDLTSSASALGPNNTVRWKSQGHWTWQDPPGVLVPGDLVTLRVTGDPHESENRGGLTPDIAAFETAWNFRALSRFYPKNFLEPDGVTFKKGFDPAESFYLTTHGIRKTFGEYVDQMQADFVGKVGRYSNLPKRPGSDGEWISLRVLVYHGRWKLYFYNYRWVDGPLPPGGIKIPPADGASDTAGTPTSPTPGGTGMPPAPPPGTMPAPGTAPEPANTTKFTVQAGVRRAKPGETVQVPVYLLNPSGVTNLNATVSYTPAVAAAQGKPVRGNVLGTALFEANTAEAGIARVGFAGSKPVADSGTLSHITFKAVGMPGDRTVLKVAVTTANGADGKLMTAETINGEVLIVGEGGKIPGDADGDGVITASDALSALKMSVKLIPEDKNLDMDRDGSVTSNDARLILMKAVGK